MDSVMTWIESNKAICWAIFWVGWFFLSPTTIIPGAVAVGVGNVIYKERALNLVTICAVYLGVMGYLLLAHAITDWPENVRLYMGFGGIFSLVVLGKRYPMFGYFLIIMIVSALAAAAAATVAGGECDRPPATLPPPLSSWRRAGGSIPPVWRRLTGVASSMIPRTSASPTASPTLLARPWAWPG
jgi:hypothetical protein